MTIIGIDADVHRVAYAVAEHGTVRAVATIERANQVGRIDARYDQLLTALMRKAQDAGAEVLLEGIYLAEAQRGAAIPRNVQAFARLAKVQGEIERAARMHAVPLDIVSPNTWHAKVLGFTRGRDELKKAAQTEAVAAVGRELSEHESDAVCLALYGARHMRSAMGVSA